MREVRTDCPFEGLQRVEVWGDDGELSSVRYETRCEPTNGSAESETVGPEGDTAVLSEGARMGWLPWAEVGLLFTLLGLAGLGLLA